MYTHMEGEWLSTRLGLVLILRPFISSCFSSLWQFTPHKDDMVHVPSVTSDCNVFIITLKFTQAKI